MHCGNNHLCHNCPAGGVVVFDAKTPPPARPTERAEEPDPCDNCPVCGLRYTAACRCRRGNRSCKNGHNWHRCPVHRVPVMGTGHGSPFGYNECCCPPHSTERPGGAADMSAPASFDFDLEDPTVKFF